MPEIILSLTLNPMQRAQFFAHLLTYLFNQAADPARPRHKATCELVQEVSYRLLHLYRQEYQAMPFALSSEEAQAIKDAFATLHDRYAQWSALDSSSLALKDLATCRLLLELAEQHADTNTESRSYDGR